ncbi:iron complex outermembrane receptor protein [Neorhizobium sp. JUb45]|nr:iron complex outermembrane receptor protein [Neorhizobium sp. JUb45]
MKVLVSRKMSAGVTIAATSVLAVMLASVSPLPVLAQQQGGTTSRAAAINYTIPAGQLSAGIMRFGDRAGLQVIFPAALVKDKTTRGISGTFTREQALSRLLDGTGLSYSFTNANTVTLRGPAAPGDAAAGGDSTQLGTITVAGQGGAFEHVDGYVANSSSTGTKGDIPILETPQSISVITSDRMKDQGVQSINEALRYTAGVRSESSGSQMMDNPLYLRGFQQSSLDTFQDGLRAVTPGYFGFFALDPYGVERIEVLKGPSSVLYGQQVPGGMVNTVSKRPTDNPVNEIETVFGSFDHYQGGFDLGGVSEDKTIMYRFVGMARDAGTQVDHVDNDRRYFAPSFTWAPDEDTKLTVLGSYQRNDGDFYAQVPAAAVLFDNPNGHIPFNRFLGEPSWEYETADRTAVGYEFQHRFNDTVQFEQNFRYTHLTNHRQYLQASGALVGNRTLNRTYNLRDIENDGIAVDNRLRFDFDTGAIEHKAIVGVDYLWGSSKWLEQRGAAPSIDIFNPVYGSPINTGTWTSRSLSDITASQAGIYAQDQIKFDNLILTLGIRQDWAWRDTENLLAGGVTTQRDHSFTKRAGLTYLFDNGIAPYVSYSESFSPVVGTDSLGNVFVPETAQQYEVGIKYQPAGFDGLFTVSAFDLARQNVQTYNYADPRVTLQTGEVRVRGFELEALANLDDGLSLTAAYTYSDAEITETETTSQLGNTPYRVPRHTASIWLNYEMQQEALDGLSIGGGVRYIGDTWGSDDNTFKVPAFTLVDVALRYDFGQKFPEAKGLSASLNVSNLFDKSYVPGCFTVNACNYGSERTFTGKLSYRW